MTDADTVMCNCLHRFSDLLESQEEGYEADSCILRWLYTGTVLEHKETIDQLPYRVRFFSSRAALRYEPLHVQIIAQWR